MIQSNKAADSPSPSNPRTGKRRLGTVLPIITAAILALAALGAILYYAFGNSGDDEIVDAILKPVTKGEFVAKVLDQGEIQSSENVEIKCQVGSRNGNVSVISVVNEGTSVSEGDWLVTLDSKAFEKELEQQKLAVSNALTQVIQSRASLAAAEATKNEYIKGTYVERLKEIENDLFSAEQELNEAEAYLEHSIKLQAKGFITQQQLRSDDIAVQRARNKVELEQQRKLVLEEITYAKEIIQLDSDIAAAKVQFENAEEALKIEERQLAEVEAQLAACAINVPEGVSGEVVFHKEFDRRGGSEWVLEPGATVREGQVLIKLPNREKMEVKVLVNEQSITSIRSGMPATVSVDALSGQSLTGYVTKVNAYAEQGGWMGSTGVREYAVFVRILNPPKELIPGMNASVTIQTEYQPDVMQSPLQCIYSANDTNFVLRQIGENKFETVEVSIVGENSQNVWIESGVEEGDQLVMDPGQYKHLMDLPELEQESRIELPEGTAVTSTEGQQPPRDPETPQEGAGKMANRGGQGGGPGGGQRGGAGEGQRRGGGGMGGSMDDRINGMYEQYDTDGDELLSDEELDQMDSRFRGMIEGADTDGDGKYSKEELKKKFEEMMSRFRQQGGGGGGPGGGGK
ncbi:MAG: HlyD family efflux transporter periplasmic adaptor subunit [Pirellulaceae bacterium]